MFEFLAMSAFCLAVPVLAMLVVTRFEPAGDGSRKPVRLTGWAFFDEALSRLRFWPAVAVCVLTALVFMSVALREIEGPVLLGLALLAVLFFRAWRYEFVGLMASPEASFPGQYDKRIWAALMIVLPPVGYSCLKAYRRAMEPVSEPEVKGKPAAMPAHDWI